MKFKDMYFGIRGFESISSSNDLRKLLRCSKKLQKDEVLNERRIVILDETNEYRSFLIFSNIRVYKIHDDKDNNDAILNWSIPLDKFKRQFNDAGLKFSKEKDLDLVTFPNKPDKIYSIDKSRFQIISIQTIINYLLNNPTKDIEQLISEATKSA